MPLYFGAKIKAARKASGLTQKQLAERLGVKNTTISNWEKDLNRPDPDTIELLCGVLGIQPGDLFTPDPAPLVNNDEELTKYLEELKNRKEMRMLFSLAAGATKEDVERTVKIVEAALGKQAKDD